ncbi:MAG: DUF1552 domain-containing protein [Acidobacteria bacterium]|nr:DUF1552 domain-containing protein [Acidobacteriota bacterium]
MMIFKKAIPRRTFLRGAGAALALPMLSSMTPAFAAAADNTGGLRLVFIYGPNGRIMKNWVPTATGANFELPPTLAPLAKFRENMLVLSGMNIKAADPVGNEAGGNHARPCAAYLTGIHPKPGGAVGISADQLAAREFGKVTQLASLEMSLDQADDLGAADGAYSDAYTKTISWRGPNTPLPMEANPRAVFQRLMGESRSTDPAERKRQAQRSRSILDFLSEDVSRVATDLGPSDRSKLNEYLEAVRDIERRIQLAEEQSSRALPSMDQPVGIPATRTEHAKLLFDLQVLAFQGDLTRVVTFMWGREQNDVAYRELGIRDGHHSLSHHSGQEAAVEACGKIDAHHSAQFAYFLDRLKSSQDGDGTLLDHSLIMYGSGMSDGNAHTHHDVPMLLVGGANGQLKGGRHIRYNALPMSNMLLTMLDLAKLPVDDYLDSKYSDATGRLDVLSM